MIPSAPNAKCVMAPPEKMSIMAINPPPVLLLLARSLMKSSSADGLTPGHGILLAKRTSTMIKAVNNRRLRSSLTLQAFNNARHITSTILYQSTTSTVPPAAWIFAAAAAENFAALTVTALVMSPLASTLTMVSPLPSSFLAWRDSRSTTSPA